jgi:glutamate synthase domain-containing protein 2
MFALGCIQSLKCNKNTCPTGITTHDRRLQKGLDPEVKSVRVANFVKRMEHGVNLIAHSCGADHPRALRRRHVRLVQGDGRSAQMNRLWPDAEDGAAA